jgi:hypothetical protein
VTGRKERLVKRKLVLATAVGALSVALTLVLAACGGNGDSNDVASLTDTTGQTTTGADQGSGAASKTDREKAALEYAKCMREHGVDFPDPVNGRFEFKAERRDQRKMQEAQEACRDILRDAAPPLTEEQEAELRQAALDFAKCMREHGVDMPDPKFGQGGGVTQLMPEGSSPDDPKVQEAQKACQPILNAAEPKNSSGQSQ